jgi:hypothetical protein
MSAEPTSLRDTGVSGGVTVTGGDKHRKGGDSVAGHCGMADMDLSRINSVWVSFTKKTTKLSRDRALLKSALCHGASGCQIRCAKR